MLHSIIGWDCVVGEWSRVEGYPNYPDPNDPFGELNAIRGATAHDLSINPHLAPISHSCCGSEEVSVVCGLVSRSSYLSSGGS